MQDWIEDFISYTSHITSPEMFRKWAGISLIAGAMERKTWVRTLGSDLYPNLYVILVAPPGVGKTEVTWRVRNMWKSLPTHHVARSSVTKASLIDDLNDGARSITRPAQVPAVLTFHSLLVSANELGVLIPAYDNEFMNVLTDLYDCKPYSESRRSRSIKIEIERPHLNILAACTPAYLTATLPEGAWDQGFTSRVILIYSGESVTRSLFEEVADNEELGKALKTRLKTIGDMSGKFTFEPEAAQLIDHWHMTGGKPRPDHPKLHHYNSRRTAHVLKLSMIASASNSQDMIIRKDHMQRALDWLTEAELHMPDIFKAMANTSHSQIIEEAWHFLFKAYNKAGRKPIAASRLINFLSQRTPAHNVARVLEVMENGGVIKRSLGKSGNEYTPIASED